MISHKSFEPGEEHLPYRKALAGHDFGFGDVKEENNMNEDTKKLLAGNDIYVGENVNVREKKQQSRKIKKGCKKCDDVQACKKPKIEKVNNPTHYNTGRIEVIDAIEDWSLGFNDGNAIKYIARHQYKGNSIQDIEKAIWYLQRHLNNLKKEVSK
tara:strand:+ start:407 stop:871 length:465 start_codon:yes stop_codon:yes gene_type:complete